MYVILVKGRGAAIVRTVQSSEGLRGEVQRVCENLQFIHSIKISNVK